MGSIRKLQGEHFQLKSAAKLMEALDVLDESKNAVFDMIRNDIKNMSEFEILSDEDECDIVLINMADKGIAIITVQGGYGMFQPVYLPLTGRSMKAALDREGMLHVFIVRNDRLWHVQEKAPHSRLFTSPEEIPFSRPYGFNRVEKLLLHPLTKEKDFVLGLVSKAGNTSYWVSYRQWETCSGFNLIQSAFSSPMLAFAGSDADELSMECLSNTYTSYSVAKMEIRFSYLLDLCEWDSVKQIYPYGSAVFALLESAEGNVPVEIRTDEKTGKATGTELIGRGDFHAMSMHTDEEGKPYMALNGSRLNYLRLVKSDYGYDCEEAMPLDNSCIFMSFNGNEKCQRIFYLLEDNKIHVLENQDNVTWRENILDLPEEGEVRRMPCYSTEMTFLRPDNHLIPLKDLEVTLWAESRTYIETSQGFIKLGTDVSTKLRTDANGKIAFKQYTNGLDVPVVYASLPSEYCPEDEAIVISQFDGIHERLSGITSQQLLDAQQTDSMSGVIQPFLPNEHHDEKTAGELAAGIQDLMKIKPQSNGLFLMKRAQLSNVSRIVSTDGLPSWSMDFSSGCPSYTRLSKEDAEKEMQLMKKRVGINGNGFFSKIADFFRSVVKGIVSVVKIVINGIKAIVEFVLNGVKMIFEAVIKVVQEIFHFVEMIFAAILISFVTIFAWLASLFIWDDVMRTKRAIKDCFALLLEKLPGQASKCESLLKNMLTEGIGEVDAAFEKFIQSIAPEQNINSSILDNTPEENPEITYEVSNNPLSFKFENTSILELDFQSIALKTEAYSELDEVIRILKETISKITGNQSFIDAANYLENAFSDIDNFLNSLLAAILSVLRGIIQAIFEGMSGVISVVFGVLERILAIFTDMLTKTIKIPFFSSFYKVIMGNDMSFIDLASMLLALPVTMIDKVILGHAPFMTDEDVSGFISQIEGYLEGTPVSNKSTRNTILLSFSAASSIFYFTMGVYLDSTTVTRKRNIEIGLPDALSLIFESLWLVFSLPACYKDSSEMKKKDYMLWGCFVFGFCVDMCVTIYAGKHIDRQRYGRIITSIYGCMHLIMDIAVAPEPLTLMSELLGSLTEIDKPLLDIEKSGITACIDTLALIFIATISIIQAASDKNQIKVSYE